MKTKVTPLPRPRILAMRVRNTIRLPMPNETVIVPVPEFPLFVSLTDAIKARHQRAAVRAEPRVA